MTRKHPEVDEITSAKHAVFVERAVESQFPVNERATMKFSSRDKDVAFENPAVNDHAEVTTLHCARGGHLRE